MWLKCTPESWITVDITNCSRETIPHLRTKYEHRQHHHRYRIERTDAQVAPRPFQITYFSFLLWLLLFVDQKNRITRRTMEACDTEDDRSSSSLQRVVLPGYTWTYLNIPGQVSLAKSNCLFNELLCSLFDNLFQVVSIFLHHTHYVVHNVDPTTYIRLTLLATGIIGISPLPVNVSPRHWRFAKNNVIFQHSCMALSLWSYYGARILPTATWTTVAVPGCEHVDRFSRLDKA